MSRHMSVTLTSCVIMVIIMMTTLVQSQPSSCPFFYQKCLYGQASQCLPWQLADADVSFDLTPDILPANTTDYYLANTGEGNDWYANICGKTTYVCQQNTAPAIMVNSLAKDTCYITAMSWVSTSVALLDPKDAGRGLTMTFDKGDYRDCTGQVQRSTRFNIQCDSRPGAVTRLIDAHIDPRDPSNRCNYVLTFNSSHACPRVVIKPPTPPPDPQPSSRLSNGSLFLILLFVFAVVYVAGFGVYNYFVAKKRGIANIMPHTQFWCSTLPGLVKDGVRYFLVLIKCPTKSDHGAPVTGGNGGYASYTNISDGSGEDRTPSAMVSSSSQGGGMAGAGMGGGVAYDGTFISNSSKTPPFNETQAKSAPPSAVAAAQAVSSSSTAIDVTGSSSRELYE